MQRELAASVFLAFVLVTGCKNGTVTTVSLPDSPDRQFRAEARVMKETLSIKIARSDQAWQDFDPIVIGQCSNVSFGWLSNDVAVLVYDKAEIAYFLSPRRYYGGATLSLCDRGSGACDFPPKSVALSTCRDHSM